MEFRVLGPLEVSEHGRPIPLGGLRQRAVLAHLLVRANTVVSTDQLIDYVWGDDAPDGARNALQSYVSRLRSALGHRDRLQWRDPGYLLKVEPAELDSLRFEGFLRQGRAALAVEPGQTAVLLEEALELWRGPALADLADQESLHGERTRLEELRTQAQEVRIAAWLETDAYPEVVPELETLVAAHPLRERFWGLLMRALYRSDRQADALRAFDRARRVLVDELGVEPSAELQALYERILERDPALVTDQERIRGYRLAEVIGEGTFGTVHRGMEPQLGREVAIKVVRSDLADRSSFIRRFEAEAQLVARLEHPHIVPLYDYWREPGAAYLVMRLLRGGSLRRLLDDGGPRRDEAIAILGELATALAFAHRRGVVHLDVKPENVLLDEEGNAYLSDFGIARHVGVPGSPPTAAGSSPYLSPEQLRGEAAGPASDVYSLGMLGAELLGVRRVGKVPSLPAGMAEVIAKATAVDLDDRYPDASAFLDAYRGAAGRLDVLAEAGPRNPYKGLLPFMEGDAGDFFGREDLVERLLGRLAEPSTRFLAIVGPSGSGKSSVVRAGLIPALRGGALPGSERWLVAVMVPGPHPMAELQEALDRVAVGSGGSQNGAGGGGPSGSLPGQFPEGTDLLLVVDQFEELFTLVEDEAQRAAFVDALAAGVGDARQRLRVVATLRADFFDRPLGEPGLAELFRLGTEPVTPLKVSELERAVVLPAARVGVEVATQLVTLIVDQVADQPGALPLLQYTLTELFSQRQDHSVGVDAYRAVGGIQGALVRRAEDIYQRLDPSERMAARQLFLRLVTLGEGVGDTRRRVPLAEMGSLQPETRAIDTVLAEFGRYRLLSFDRDPASRAPTVEVAHEALLTEWGRLRGWIDAAREDIRSERALAAAAADWATSSRDPSYLLRGARLAQFEAWASSSRLILTDLERTYLEASTAAREKETADEQARRRREEALERRSVRRLRALVAVLAAATLLSAGLTIFAFAQQGRADRQARIATGRELASAAVANLEDDPERSILLALEAVEATEEGSPLKEALAALHQSLQASRVVMGVPGDFPAAFSPKEDLLATSPGEEGVIRLWRVPSGEPVGTLEGHTGRVIQIEITPDGNGLVSSSLDGSARRWDLETGTEACRFVGHTDGVLSMSLARQGGLLATRSFDNTVRIWDATTCDERLSLPYDALGLHFHPDGRRLAIAIRGVEAVVVDTESGEELSGVGSAPRDVRFSHDGALLAVAQEEGGTVVVDVETQEVRFTVGGHEGFTEAVDFSPDGSLMATGGQDGTARVWDASSGDSRLVLVGVGSNVEHVTFSPSSELLAGGGTSGRVLVWDVSPAGSREVRTIVAGSQPVLRTSFSPDGKYVAASTRDGVAGVWRADTGELVVPLDREDGLEFGVWWSPNGTRLVTSGPSRDSPGDILTEWDLTGDIRGELLDAPLTFTAVIDPSGRRLATAGDGGMVRVWDLATTELLWERDPGLGHISELTWSPDGSSLAAATQADVVWLWDPVTDQTARLRGHANVVNAVVWHPHGGFLASGGEDGSIRVWSVGESDAQPLVISGHAGSVLDLAWSGDGSRLASAGFDATARIWDPDTGAELLVLPSENVVGAVSFSADDRHLAVGGEDGLVRIYTLDSAELLEIARGRLTRGLTDEECRTYLHLQSCP